MKSNNNINEIVELFKESLRFCPQFEIALDFIDFITLQYENDLMVNSLY
jgi:hypothetical protein